MEGDWVGGVGGAKVKGARQTSDDRFVCRLRSQSRWARGVGVVSSTQVAAK